MKRLQEDCKVSKHKHVNKCYCRNCSYNINEAPLTRDIMVFLHIMREVLVNCALSGGAVLAEMLHQNRQCHHCLSPKQWNVQMNRSNSDIDFFVHWHPSKLNAFYGQSPDPHFSGEGNIPKTFHEVFMEKILPKCNLLFKSWHKGPLQITNLKRIWVREEYSLNSIVQIMELSFVNHKGSQIIQIIALDSFPEVHIPWTQFIVDQFDIDTVKNTVELPMNNFPMVKFVHQPTNFSLDDCSFQHTIRPGQCFETGLKRICKYLQRGFSLREIEFHPQVMKFWKDHWMGRFHILFVPFWCQKLIEKSAPNNPTVLEFAASMEWNQTVCDLTGEFVWEPPEVVAHNENMQEQVTLE